MAGVEVAASSSSFVLPTIGLLDIRFLIERYVSPHCHHRFDCSDRWPTWPLLYSLHRGKRNCVFVMGALAHVEKALTPGGPGKPATTGAFTLSKGTFTRRLMPQSLPFMDIQIAWQACVLCRKHVCKGFLPRWDNYVDIWLHIAA